MSDISEFLEHRGVKGMKWGVRRKSSTSPKKTSADHKKIAELRKKSVPQLTNKQLKAHNERMNLAQNFNKLNPSKAKRGRQHITEIVATVGAVTAIYNSPLGKVGKAFIKGPKGKHFKS